MSKVRRVCPACGGRFVPPTGPKDAEMALVGQSPGRAEFHTGEPFVGPSGKLLDAVLYAVHLPRETVYLTNSVKCEGCRPDRAALIEELRALPNLRMVVLLGAQAWNTLFPKGDKISTVMGLPFRIEELDVWAVPTIHPAAVLRNADHMRDFEFSMRNAKRFMHEAPRPLDTQYEVVDTPAEALAAIERLMREVQDVLAVDIETSGMHWYDTNGHILCISLSWDVGKALVIGASALKDPSVREALRKLFAKDVAWVGHNFPFDWKWMQAKWGFAPPITHDTLVMSYVLDERTRGSFGTYRDLKGLAMRFLGVTDWEADLRKFLQGKNQDFALLPKDVLYRYSAHDPDATLRLWRAFKVDIEADGCEKMYELTMRAQRLFADLDRRGILVDLAYGAELVETLNAQLGEIEQALSRIAGGAFNPRSHTQVGALLFDELGLPVIERTPNGAPSTAKNVLGQLQRMFPEQEVLQLLLEHRRVTNLLGSYVEPLLELAKKGNGYIYVDSRATGTVTGRIAQSKPAVVTVPRDPQVRRLFIAPEGHYMAELDYSQNELRCIAALSCDPYMCEMFREGYDFHTAGAIAVFGEHFTKEQRTRVKNLNFAWVYSGGSMASAIGPDTPEELVHRVERAYREKMPVVMRWFETVGRQALSDGYVESPLGRRRRFPLITRGNEREVMKEAVNMLSQSLSSDMTFLALEECERRNIEGFSARWMMHDGILGYVRADRLSALEEVASIMREVGNQLLQDVPVEVDVEYGPSWGELQTYSG